jgi:hypothetical protein
MISSHPLLIVVVNKEYIHFTTFFSLYLYHPIGCCALSAVAKLYNKTYNQCGVEYQFDICVPI